MTRIIIDIETIPSQQPGARDTIRAGIKPPGTLKKAESIAAWWQTEADAAVEDAYRKQSLDGGTHGEIASIALTGADMDTDAGWSHCRKRGESEADLLMRFGEAVQQRVDDAASTLVPGRYFSTEPWFIAHNASFDLGFLWRRCIINAVHLPFKLPDPSARHGKDYGDTMTLWAGYGGRISLDTLCHALGVPSPKEGGIDGAGVFDAWLAGEYERIAQYNLSDVLATRDVWHRLQGGGHE